MFPMVEKFLSGFLNFSVLCFIFHTPWQQHKLAQSYVINVINYQFFCNLICAAQGLFWISLGEM